jgi:hypothetical protein
MNKPHLILAKEYWKRHLKPSDFAIDATCGNGHDTLYLSTLLSEGLVYSIDIQKIALEKTQSLLGQAKNVKLFHQSHADPLPLPKPPRLIVSNLGYLPGGDKSLTTMTTTTLQSLRLSLSILAPDGAISITCYPCHDEGAEEEIALLAFLKDLNYNYHQWERARSPTLFWIKR